MPSPVRSRRRWLFVAWLPFATLLLLEIVMQVGALGIWLLSRNDVPPLAAASRTVLCVGDSWTHGIGASDSAHSYPAVLQELLAARAAESWTVVNCGRSGQDSRDLLERLPSQLAEFRPHVVCVLVGQNDYSSTPQLLPETDAPGRDHRAYRFRWRLPRLWSWMSGKLTGAGQIEEQPLQPRVGPEWQKRTVTVSNPHARERAPWTWSEAARAAKQDGWRLEAAKDQDGALLAFERALELAPGDGECLQMLANLHRTAGRVEMAAKLVHQLRDRHARSPGYWTSVTLGAALLDASQSAEAFEVLDPATAKFPMAGRLWQLHGRAALHLGRIDQAARSLDQAIAIGGDAWHWYWRFKVAVFSATNAAAAGDNDAAIAVAARTMFDCYAVFNDDGMVERALLTLEVEERMNVVAAVLRDYEGAADVRQRLQRIVDDVNRQLRGSGASRVLARHLERIVGTVRRAGATPILLCYPLAHKAEPVLRRVAEDRDETFVETSREFARRRGARSLAELRAADGHCNDAGYRIMAEIVADTLVPLLPRR
jgi:lysophospholipase L1-like esterase